MNLIKNKWTNEDTEPFLNLLQNLSKGNEKSIWEKRIVNTNLSCLAVPSTEIDKIAKQIFKGNYISFLNLWIWNNHSSTLIFGKILNKIKDFSLLKSYLIPYSEKADNWSTIDCLKINFNNGNINKFIKLSKELIQSKHTFSRRLALIILLKLLSVQDCTAICFELFNKLKDESEYYVNMAAAWVLAECMAKFRDKTLEFYNHNNTNDFIINKSISKCRDSFRITKTDKDYLLKFKRN